MSILRYEFTDAPETSYSGYLGQLVGKLRHTYSRIPATEIKDHMPPIWALEEKLQSIDKDCSEPHREYIAEVYEALQKEADIEDNLMTELKETWLTIATIYKLEEPSVDDFDFTYFNQKACQWLTLMGLKEGVEDSSKLIIGKEVLRAACNKFNVIFIDLS